MDYEKEIGENLVNFYTSLSKVVVCPAERKPTTHYFSLFFFLNLNVDLWEISRYDF